MVMETRSRNERRQRPPGLWPAVVVLLALLVMAPVLPQVQRAVQRTGLEKVTLFRNEISRALDDVPVAIHTGRAFSEALLAEQGGWDGGEVPWVATGTFTVAPRQVPAPDPQRRQVNVLVRVEDGLPVNADAFSLEVMGILNDPRGWGPIDGVSFARTDVDADAAIVVTLASPATTEMLCGELPTRGYTSCGRGRPVNINAARWTTASTAFLAADGDLHSYREYVVNHEVGHSLGHGHETCAEPAALAPVMMQQTLTVGECRANGWPAP